MTVSIARPLDEMMPGTRPLILPWIGVILYTVLIEVYIHDYIVINRPGVAGALLPTATLLIHSFIHSFIHSVSQSVSHSVILRGNKKTEEKKKRRKKRSKGFEGLLS